MLSTTFSVFAGLTTHLLLNEEVETSGALATAVALTASGCAYHFVNKLSNTWKKVLATSAVACTALLYSIKPEAPKSIFDNVQCVMPHPQNSVLSPWREGVGYDCHDYLQMKLVSHAFEIRGKSRIHEKDTALTNMEGFTYETNKKSFYITPENLIFHHLEKTLDDFVKIDHFEEVELKNIGDTIKQTLKNAAIDIDIIATTEATLKRIHEKQPTILNSGWWQHSISLIFVDEYMAIVNTANGLDPLTVFKIDPSLMTQDHIQVIAWGRMYEEYTYSLIKWFYQSLPMQLNGEKVNGYLKDLEPDLQIVGNCAYASKVGAVRTLMLYLLIKDGYDETEAADIVRAYVDYSALETYPYYSSNPTLIDGVLDPEIKNKIEKTKNDLLNSLKATFENLKTSKQECPLTRMVDPMVPGFA